jgi:taurine dioxygenase
MSAVNMRRYAQKFDPLREAFMTYRTISVNRISGALGAEISGVDLSQKLDDAAIGEIRHALTDNQVIFFRDQHLTPEQHLAFGRRFGELQVHEFVEGIEDNAEILEVRKEADETRNFGGGWHTDVSYLDRPALGSVLYAREVPAVGGDTMFASQYLAYDTLSDGMKSMLGEMTAVHSARRPYGLNASRRFAAGERSMKYLYSENAHGEVEHPVIRTHVETGRKSLYVNGTFTIRFKDMTEEESAPLLNYLCQHAVRPEFTCRFRWQKGSIAFWDNRCVQHNAVNDYHGQRRVMHRVTIEGERPV